MTLPADLSAVTVVLPETPIQDFPCMKVTQIRAGACIGLQCVYLQSVLPGHVAGVDRYEVAELLRDLVPLETPMKRGALFIQGSGGSRDGDRGGTRL